MTTIGIASLRQRTDFLVGKTISSLLPQVDKIAVYADNYILKPYLHNKIDFTTFREEGRLGDAGKFLGITKPDEVADGYYFVADDDISYPPSFIQDMVRWIEYYDRQCVVCLAGSHLRQFPIEGYYKDKITFPAVGGEVDDVHRVLFPMTCGLGFHTSLFEHYPLNIQEFPVVNMADIWFGIALQKRNIPAIVVPHTANYLAYNEELDLKDTIWGQENQNDFIQTALVNQFARQKPGWRLPQVQLPLADPPGRLFRELPLQPDV